MRKLLISLFLVLLLPLLVFGADAYNQGTLTVQYETDDAVCLKWVVSTGTDSTGSKHSPAINIGGANYQNGRIRAVAESTSDVNILVHNLIDNNPATSLSVTTYEGLDAVSSTAKVDTLGWLDGAEVIDYRIAPYISVEVDGQTGTAADVDITLYIVLRKNTSAAAAPRPHWVMTVGSF